MENFTQNDLWKIPVTRLLSIVPFFWGVKYTGGPLNYTKGFN